MHDDIRKALVVYGKKMAELTVGSGGNLSARCPGKKLIWISPTGIECHAMKTDDVLGIDTEGKVEVGSGKPSSEILLHLALYRSRPEIGAVVHTHSTYATTCACLHLEIPAIHYLIGLAGEKIPLAPYALFGTAELAEKVSGVMTESDAALLANHGLVTVGKNLAAAFNLAQQVEFVARLYCQCLAIGKPKLLDRSQIQQARQKFKTYGR